MLTVSLVRVCSVTEASREVLTAAADKEGIFRPVHEHTLPIRFDGEELKRNSPHVGRSNSHEAVPRLPADLEDWRNEATEPIAQLFCVVYSGYSCAATWKR